jgi:hypothetical protein
MKWLIGGLYLGFISIVILGCTGWVMNIVQLIRWHGDVTALFIIKIVGAFIAPIGAVLGWF